MTAAKQRCKKYRKRILEMSQKVTALHVAPAFSCMEIVDIIYNELMNQDDVFIMSKGHGCVAQYVVLEDLGILDVIDISLYCDPKGILGAHPDYNTNIDVQASTGSLGHGLGICVGRAYAKSLKSTDNKTYCLLSDGEMAEGSTWEAILMAANLELNNLVAFVDNNDYGGLEKISQAQPDMYPLVDKFNSFGWDATLIDGHDSKEIYETVDQIPRDRPLAVICKTEKGYPISYMQDAPIWHYRSPNPEEYRQAIKEIESL